MHIPFVGAFLGACMTAALVSGCATAPPRATSTITEFHRLEALSPSDTFAIVPRASPVIDTLAFETYAMQMRQGLQARGYRVVYPGEPARYLIQLGFGMDEGRSETTSHTVPQFGVTGVITQPLPGTAATPGDPPRFYTTPIYGVVCHQQHLSTQRIYRRHLHVDVVDTAQLTDGQPTRVYEGRLVSEGACGVLTTVMPALITAWVQGFPGASGSARQVTVPMAAGPC